jgi:hypothetical protein
LIKKVPKKSRPDEASPLSEEFCDFLPIAIGTKGARNFEENHQNSSSDSYRITPSLSPPSGHATAFPSKKILLLFFCCSQLNSWLLVLRSDRYRIGSNSDKINEAEVKHLG